MGLRVHVEWDKVWEFVKSILVPAGKELVVKLVEHIYQLVEEWAKHLPQKPNSGEKREKFLEVAKVMDPTLDHRDALQLMETYHLARTRREGKTA